MTEENKERVITVLIIVLIITVVVLIIRMTINRVAYEIPEVEKVELVGDIGIREEEPEKVAPTRKLVDTTPDFSREKEEIRIEVQDWDNRPSIPEQNVAKVSTVRYELGEIIEVISEVPEPEKEEKLPYVHKIPIDDLDMRYDINFSDMTGKNINRDEFDSGKQTVLMVWSENYPESIEALRVWNGVYKKEKDNYNFIFLNRGYGHKEDIKSIEEFLEREKMDIPVYLDREMMFQMLRPASLGYPSTYYLTAAMDIHEVTTKKQTKREIEKSLKSIPENIVREEVKPEVIKEPEKPTVEPIKPAVPVSPTIPVRPKPEVPKVEPVTPKVEPTKPIIPVRPKVEPTKPTIPVRPPVEPTKPTIPVRPKVEPTKPVEKPVIKPELPVDPERPEGI